MNYFQNIYSSGLKGLAKLALAFFSSIGILATLTACSVSEQQGPQPVFQNNTNAQYLFELELQSGDTIASLSNEYQAEVIVWEPEDNFAILASSQKVDSEFLPQSLGLDKNQDVLEIAVSAQGGFGWASGSFGWASGDFGWASGRDGWASGKDGWASGRDGWMSGHNGWGLGVNTAFLSSNKATWKQIGLFGAHRASDNLGFGKVVAIIDTGIDLNHPMLKDSLVDQSLWRDYYDYDYVPQDASYGLGAGHGTAVAGIVLQVAPQAKILPIRVLGANGTGDMDDVILAVRHAVKSGADIINISIGSFDNSRTLKRILRYAGKKGVYVVAAGGNTGQENGVLYPAGFSTTSKLKGNVFSVGSVDVNDKISTFSASGNNLTAYAPGEKIRTTFPNNRLADVSGTSFAAPIMAGSLALVYDKLQYIQNSGADVEQRIQDSLEKDRIETKYNLESIDQSTWKYAGGILDTNSLLHLITLQNANFEDGESGWAFSKATVAPVYTGQNYKQIKQMAKIAVGGSISKQLYNLRPNTTYEIKFRTVYYTNGQNVIVSLKNFGGSDVAQTFRKGSEDKRLISPNTIEFTTGPNNTSANFTISNTISSASVAIDGFKIRMKD